MFSWVRKGLITGVVTTRYPRIPETLPGTFRGRPVLNAERCQAAEGCTACVQVCLPGALSVTHLATNGQTPVLATDEPDTSLGLDYGRCIMCGLCASACPAQALVLTNDYELATTTREDLSVTVRFYERPRQGTQQEGR